MAAKTQGNDLSQWADVGVFLAAHRSRTLAAAAVRLGLDTSTVSRRLTVFESSLGLRLFERGRDGLQPTAAAERVLAAAEAIEAAHARLTRDASDIEATAQGTVRLSAAPGIAEAIIAPALATLRRRHPKICIELDTSTRALNLGRYEADLAVRSVNPVGADLLVTKLQTVSWVVAASKPLAKKLGALTSWSPAPWVTWDREFERLPPAQWLVRHVPDADVALRTGHFLAQLRAAEQGLGLVLIPRPYLPSFELVEVQLSKRLRPAAELLPRDSLWLVGHRALRDVPRVAAVWSFLIELLRVEE